MVTPKPPPQLRITPRPARAAPLVARPEHLEDLPDLVPRPESAELRHRIRAWIAKRDR
jgi:hypothetical protein